MAAGFGYSADTPEGCWDDLARHDRSQPDRPGRRLARGHRRDRRRPGRGAGSPWPGPRPPSGTCSARPTTRRSPSSWAPSTSRSAWGSSRASPSASIPSIVELLKAIETHLAEGYRRVKIKIQPGSDVELVRAVRQHFGDDPPHGRRQRRLHRRRPRRLPRARRLRPADVRAADGGRTTSTAWPSSRRPSPRRSASTRRPRPPSRPPRRSDAGPAGSSTSRSSASGGWARPGRSTTSATSTASPAGSARCPSSASARPSASTWPRWPTASTRPTSSRPPAGSSTTTSSPPLELSVAGPVQRPRPGPALGFQVDPVKLRRYQVRQAEFTASTTAPDLARRRPMDRLRDPSRIPRGLRPHGPGGRRLRRDRLARPGASPDRRHPRPPLGPVQASASPGSSRRTRPAPQLPLGRLPRRRPRA